MQGIEAFFEELGPLSEPLLQQLRPKFVRSELKQDAYFVREGECSSQIAFLEQGVVRAFCTTREGKEYNKTFFTAPAIIGSYASLISREKNKLPQQALTDCVIWALDYAVIEQLSQGNYELERLRRKVAERFFVGNEKKELEMALLDAAQRYQIFKNEFPGLEDCIPQYHVASYLGITPTQLSRIRQAQK